MTFSCVRLPYHCQVVSNEARLNYQEDANSNSNIEIWNKTTGRDIRNALGKTNQKRSHSWFRNGKLRGDSTRCNARWIGMGKAIDKRITKLGRSGDWHLPWTRYQSSIVSPSRHLITNPNLRFKPWKTSEYFADTYQRGLSFGFLRVTHSHSKLE